MWDEREAAYFAEEERAQAVYEAIDEAKRIFMGTWRVEVADVFNGIREDIYRSADIFDAFRDNGTLEDETKQIIRELLGDL